MSSAEITFSSISRFGRPRCTETVWLFTCASYLVGLGRSLARIRETGVMDVTK